jgi:homoserine O-succinyltransferase/O-acetyltransferase
MNAMARPSSQLRPPITIGLVNNMPDAALLATERQFMRLIEPAAEAHDLHLRLFYLPEIARGGVARMQVNARYAPIDALPQAGIDALIVTGCEPIKSSLADEPYWPSLVRLIEWSKANTVSTIWSCLAAHAAVLHLDGIVREKLPDKLVGVFPFNTNSKHPLLAGITAPVQVPHSRLNGLIGTDLAECGYELLTHSREAGVDAFVRQYESLFVFLQGHPEYEVDSLYREYRRDLTRYVAGQQQKCPALPANYFDQQASRALAAFAEQARSARSPAILEHFPLIEADRLSRTDWRGPAARFFSNWIGYIADAKAAQARAAHESLTRPRRRASLAERADLI